MDFYELLKEDHRKVDELLNRIEQSKPAAEKRQEYFLELKQELELHSFVEEVIVYSALQDVAQTAPLALHAREEHRVVQMLLDEMEGLDPDDEEWTAKFKVLQESVRNHVQEEEGEMFPAARKILSDEQAEELGARITTAKAMKRASFPEPAHQED